MNPKIENGNSKLGRQAQARVQLLPAGMKTKFEIRKSKLEDVHRQECLCYCGRRLLPAGMKTKMENRKWKFAKFEMGDVGKQECLCYFGLLCLS